MAELRAQYIQSAIAAGKSATEARQLANDLGLIPSNVDTDYTLNGAADADTQLATLKDSIKKLPKSTQAKIIAALEKGGFQEAYAMLSKIDGNKADVWLESLLDRGGIKDWESYKPKSKTATITTKYKYVSVGAPVGGKVKKADGGLMTRAGAGLVESFADGGYPSIGGQQPQIQPNQGPKGIMWAETGAGPWEAFISGHPAKRDRSRAILADVAERLGGRASFANGGIYDAQRTLYGQQSAGASISITSTTYYPVAEPESTATNRKLQQAAALGRI